MLFVLLLFSEVDGRGGSGGGGWTILVFEEDVEARLVFMGAKRSRLLFVSNRANFGSIAVLLRFRRKPPPGDGEDEEAVPPLVAEPEVGVRGNGKLAVVVLGEGEGEASENMEL